MKEEIKRINDEIHNNYRMRFYPKQKKRFRNYITGEFKKLGYEDIKIDSAKNIIIGDADNAEKVYTAHYDTPMLSFYLTPFARIFGHLIGQFISAVVLVAVFLALPVFIHSIFEINFLLVSYIILLALIILHCLPNPNNANDNTSGVLTVLFAAMKIKKNGSYEKIAFILFNNEELGLLGSGKFAKEYKKRNGKRPEFMVYNFDCTGVGKNLLVATKGGSAKSIAKDINNRVINKEGKKIIRINGSLLFASDYLQFRNGLMFSAVNPSLLRFFYLPRVHMPYDNKIDFDCIEKICNYSFN